MSEKKISNHFKDLIILLLVVLIVIGLWLLCFFLTLKYSLFLSQYYPLDKSGQIGDLFGSVNALFSGLAFAGLIYTIYLQRKELAIQQEVIIKSQEEFTKLFNAQNAQNQVTLNALKIEALKTLIEATKIHAEYNPTTKDKSLERMMKVSEKIMEISNTLENQLLKDNPS